MGLNVDIVTEALRNDDYRREVVTGDNTQVVLMTVQPGDAIGAEVHEDHDQMLLFVAGRGEAVIAGRRSDVHPNRLVFVPAGTEHDFINTGEEPLRLVTFYAPPEHASGTVHATKREADAAEH